jgi:hypothetical protein
MTARFPPSSDCLIYRTDLSSLTVSLLYVLTAQGASPGGRGPASSICIYANRRRFQTIAVAISERGLLVLFRFASAPHVQWSRTFPKRRDVYTISIQPRLTLPISLEYHYYYRTPHASCLMPHATRFHSLTHSRLGYDCRRQGTPFWYSI